MGEYADMFIDNLMFGGRDPWGGKSRGGHRPRRIKCDTCGTICKWLEDNTGWYLAEYDEGSWVRHSCKMGKFPSKPTFTPERAYAALVMLRTRELMEFYGLIEQHARIKAIEEFKAKGQIPDDYT